MRAVGRAEQYNFFPQRNNIFIPQDDALEAEERHPPPTNSFVLVPCSSPTWRMCCPVPPHSAHFGELASCQQPHVTLCHTEEENIFGIIYSDHLASSKEKTKEEGGHVLLTSLLVYGAGGGGSRTSRRPIEGILWYVSS
jgi:hypothetical protein